MKGGVCLELQQIRQAFIDSVIRVVARVGLVKATTKAIAAEAGLNETYIYKCFSSKDELFRIAFEQEDDRFARLLRGTLPVMQRAGLTWRERAFLLWSQCWEFVLDKEEDCLFYIRYYYSAECRKYAYDRHLRCFHELAGVISASFRPETNTDMLMHQIFDTMLAFSLRVLNGEMENNEETTKWTFRQIYSFVAPNVREEVLGKAESLLHPAGIAEAFNK